MRRRWQRVTKLLVIISLRRCGSTCDVVRRELRQCYVSVYISIKLGKKRACELGNWKNEKNMNFCYLFMLKCSWFTMLRQFLPYSKVTPSHTYIHSFSHVVFRHILTQETVYSSPHRSNSRVALSVRLGGWQTLWALECPLIYLIYLRDSLVCFQFQASDNFCSTFQIH